MATREDTRTPVIGEVWFRRGKVVDRGSDAQRYAWAAAATGEGLHCHIIRGHVERAGVVCVDFRWTQEVPIPPPEWMREGMVARKLIDGTYTLPLDRFLLEWEPMTRERT